MFCEKSVAVSMFTFVFSLSFIYTAKIRKVFDIPNYLLIIFTKKIAYNFYKLQTILTKNYFKTLVNKSYTYNINIIYFANKIFCVVPVLTRQRSRNR